MKGNVRLEDRMKSTIAELSRLRPSLQGSARERAECIVLYFRASLEGDSPFCPSILDAGTRSADFSGSLAAR